MTKWVVAFILLTAALGRGEKPMRMSEFVPREMHGWKAKDKDEIYNRDAIFRYMNGAGELYRSYGFQELLVCRFLKAGQPDIVVEIYDMGSSEDAFGVFTHEHEGDEIGIGQGSEYGASWLRFWKGNFYVSVFAERETRSAKQTVLDLGKAIAKAIKFVGPKPKLLTYLPTDGLLERSVRYFHNHVCLNYHYFVASQNILYLNQNTEAVLARYQSPINLSQVQNLREVAKVLLVRYPNVEQARAAFGNFINAYLPEAKQTSIVQTENGKWTTGRAERNFIIVVFDASTRAEAEVLIEGVRNKLQMEEP